MLKRKLFNMYGNQVAVQVMLAREFENIEQFCYLSEGKLPSCYIMIELAGVFDALTT